MQARDDTTTRVLLQQRRAGRRDTVVDAIPSGMLATDGPRIGRPSNIVARRYRLERQLGTGSSGSVYEGFDGVTRTRCAVKVLHDRLAQSREHVERFLREAWIVASIGHPGVVPILDAGRDAEGRCYLVFELLAGEDLDTAMQRGAVGQGDAIDITRLVLDVLDTAHQRAIIHRDVKPENIYLTRNASAELEVRLLDFGIAKLAAASARIATVQGAQLGSPYYMSPEQWRSETVGPATDLWSIGAVLFHMLTGRPPFEAEDVGELRYRVITQAPPTLGQFRPDLPTGLAAVIDRALAPRAIDRWPSAAAMADALVRTGATVDELDWDDWSH